MRNTEYKTERKPTWRQPRLGRQILICSAASLPPNFRSHCGGGLREESPDNPGIRAESVSEGKQLENEKSTALWRSGIARGAADRWDFSSQYPIFLSFTLSLQLLFSFYCSFFPFAPLFGPVPQPHYEKAKGKQEKAPPPPPEGKPQPPALPTEPGWGCHLVPGARPVFLSQTVLTTLDQGIFAPPSPTPQAWSVLRPWPLGRSDTSVFYFNEGTWPLGLSFLVSRSRGAQLAVGRPPRVLPRPYQALMPCKVPCAHAAPAAAP